MIKRCVSIAIADMLSNIPFQLLEVAADSGDRAACALVDNVRPLLQLLQHQSRSGMT